jgi:glycosyltransferase involved in cell wall biosynthesis
MAGRIYLKPFYHRFSKMPLVSISAAQRKPLPHANFVATIHHGIPADLHRPAFGRGRYLAFLGRISPEKRPDRAIRIAQRVGIPLKIAAKVERLMKPISALKFCLLLMVRGSNSSARSTSEKKRHF